MSWSYFINGILLIGMGISGVNCKVKSQNEANEQKGFAVIELFTSEGCSSCPAAEEAIAKLVAKNEEQVYVLSYHIDYWNRLGWKDSFSKAEYSQRQSKYAATFNLNSIYTPQIVFNGSSEFVGSNEAKLKNAVMKSSQQVLASNVSINVIKTNNTIAVNYAITNNEEVLLNLALVQPKATTEIKHGENGGRTLYHVNVVRFLHILTANGKGKASIEIPKELAYIPLNIIAFTQDKKTLKVLGADRQFL